MPLTNKRIFGFCRRKNKAEKSGVANSYQILPIQKLHLYLRAEIESIFGTEIPDLNPRLFWVYRLYDLIAEPTTFKEVNYNVFKLLFELNYSWFRLY